MKEKINEWFDVKTFIGVLCASMLAAIIGVVFIYKPAMAKAQAGLRHTETWVGNNALMFSVTQLFFMADECQESEENVKALLNDLGYQYINLHYTEDGYYTMDITKGASYFVNDPSQDSQGVVREKVCAALDNAGFFYPFMYQGVLESAY